MKISICDDDNYIIISLQECINEFFSYYNLELPEISVFNNGEDLLADNTEKEIVFLDIELPGLDGIYVGNELTKSNKDIIIIIITSYMEYLDAAMRFKVFRYLSKPIDNKRLFLNLKDVLKVYNANSTKIAIETKSDTHCVSTHEIIMVESQKNKVTIYTTKGCYKSIKPISFWNELLTEQCFFRTHRSFIINFDHLSHFDQLQINLYDDKYIAYLTKRKYTTFKNSYLLYLECQK